MSLAQREYGSGILPGHHLGTIVVPEQPANLAWGDTDYSTLYITATTSVYKISTRAHGFIPYLPVTQMIPNGHRFQRIFRMSAVDFRRISLPPKLLRLK